MQQRAAHRGIPGVSNTFDVLIFDFEQRTDVIRGAQSTSIERAAQR